MSGILTGVDWIRFSLLRLRSPGILEGNEQTKIRIL
jgi:hypothetical protein